MSARRVVALAALLLGACAPPPPLLPGDAGVPFPDFGAVHAEAASACRGVRTFTAEIGLSGRAAGEALRGRILAGFERPSSIHLDGLAPFGPPVFTLVSDGAATILYLPRDQRVLRGATAAEVLGAIAGVALPPADLQALLTGCVTATPVALGGRLHRNGWVAVDLEGGATVYLARTGDRWRPRAARRLDWVVEYPPFTGTFPDSVVLRSTRDPVEVTAQVSQFEANTDIDPAAFTVEVPAATAPISLAELRAAGPLRDTTTGP